MTMDFSAIFGHKQACAALERLATSGRAHGYLLAGPRAVPKRALGEAFAAAILDCTASELDRQPTFTRLSCPIDEKTGEKKKQIPVDAADALVARLALSGIGNKPKVALIDDADALNDYAQNALLKTVEEPAGATVLIFLADDGASLLPTLRSRIVTIALHPTSAEVDAALAPSLPAVRDFLRAPRSQRLVAASAMTKGDEAQAADALHAFVEAVAHDVHSTFVQKCATMGSEERRAYVDALVQLADTGRLLRENASATLVLERLALSLPIS